MGLSVVLNEDDCESKDSLGKHITSPAFMPHKDWNFPETISLPPSALSNGNMIVEKVKVHLEIGHEQSESLAPKSPGLHKLSKGQKFCSMLNLAQAAEDCEAEQDAPSSSPKTSPYGVPIDKHPHSHVASSEHNGSSTGSGSPKSQTLDHTVGSVPSWSKMRRSRSVVDITHTEESEAGAKKPTVAVDTVVAVPDTLVDDRAGHSLLFVLDMDHTMVGNLVALSDRDNVETNIEWSYWPEGVSRGLSVEDIIPYLERGMLRPGLLQLLQYLRSIGSTVVVYTHSEKKWATKVCKAMEQIAGWPFIARIFSRQDCRDGHSHFLARKSLEYVVKQMHEEEGFRWSKVEQAVMFDDDVKALSGSEQCRLVQVPSYDYWEPCPWDTVVTQDVMKRNDEEVVDMVRRSVVEWGIAEPSYGQVEEKTPEVLDRDRRWGEQQRRKQNILLSYNKVAKLDRVMHSLKEVLQEQPDFSDAVLEALPVRFRAALGDAHAAAPPSIGRRTRN